MSQSAEDASNLFSFMVVRHPNTVGADQLARHYLFDERIADFVAGPAELFSEESNSQIGRLVYEKVFCPEPVAPVTSYVPESEVVRPTPRSLNMAIMDAAIGLLPAYYAPCANAQPPANAIPIAIETLAGRNFFEHGGTIRVIPERLEDSGASWYRQLCEALKLIREAGTTAEIRALPEQLAKLFDAAPLYNAVFDGSGHRAGFLANRRVLFDNLYLLYVLRRGFELSLEDTIDGLRTLRIVELLAIDELLAELLREGGTSAGNEGVFAMLQNIHPELSGWDFKADLPGFPRVGSRARLRELLDATPVVHPLFARLYYFRTPFNTIKPIGIGDLKVVKQTSLGYRAGDIAHIDNVLQREVKSRTHRRLEKSEDTFSFGSEERSESLRDNQSTDRAELKNEVQSTINTVLSVNANASVTYKGSPVVATVSGGVAYNRTANDVRKTTATFARDVVDHAVKRVESRVTQQRSSTRSLETEETNVHTFDNKEGTGHVSGIYRWVDRCYRSQVYNFGKRLMFEFVIPEPAAFLVESRLRAFEATLDVPQPPQIRAATTLSQYAASLRPEHIDETKFRELQMFYDLSEFSYPQVTKRIEIVDQASGRNFFQEQDIVPTRTWQARSYEARVDARGYQITKVLVSGHLFFWGQDGSLSDDPNTPGDKNTFELRLNGHTIINHVDNTRENWYPHSEPFVVNGMAPIVQDTLSVFLGFWDISTFRLSLAAELTLDAATLHAWRSRVYHKIMSIEYARLADIDEQNRQIHAAETARYKARLSELKASAMADLLRGQSAVANRQLIVDELKKHCVTMIAREFDVDPSDDTLWDMQAVGSRQVQSSMPVFRIHEGGTATTARYENANIGVGFPGIDIPTARSKGRFVQFLEQAFEWQQIAFMLYPYFWAKPERWVGTMSRQDPADPQFSAFLQAGSARVLVAVTPAYEDAVMHFIATGEPWDGGPSPAIGDPLFLPIHQELRRQQDDLYGGTPDGESWEFTLPTALVYLENSSTPLPAPPVPPTP